MSAFDDRIVKVIIEVGNEIKTYEDLQIQASGTKTNNALQNEFEIKITNLSKATRDFILSESNILDRNKINKRITLEAGRKSYGTSIIYVGDIRMVTVSQPPDIAIIIKTYTGNQSKNEVVSRSQGALVSLSVLSKQIALDLGLELIFQATDKQISNYSFTGAKLTQINKLNEMGGINAFVDDTRLIVTDKDKPIIGAIKILNKNTGMIGVPQLTERGLTAKMLLDNETLIGGVVEVESTINTSVNGTYVIYKMSYDIASRDNNFYVTIECNRNKSNV